MAELLFVSHSNNDKKGLRVISYQGIVVNIYYSVEELNDPKSNSLCGLSKQDVTDIKAWLSNKGKENHAENNNRQSDRLL